jgi:hypothetical protein
MRVLNRSTASRRLIPWPAGRLPGRPAERLEAGGADAPSTLEVISMPADLELLLISVYCTADDLLAELPRNGGRRLSDAETVTPTSPNPWESTI